MSMPLQVRQALLMLAIFFALTLFFGAFVPQTTNAQASVGANNPKCVVAGVYSCDWPNEDRYGRQCLRNRPCDYKKEVVEVKGTCQFVQGKPECSEKCFKNLKGACQAIAGGGKEQPGQPPEMPQLKPPEKGGGGGSGGGESPPSQEQRLNDINKQLEDLKAQEQPDSAEIDALQKEREDLLNRLANPAETKPVGSESTKGSVFDRLFGGWFGGGEKKLDPISGNPTQSTYNDPFSAPDGYFSPNTSGNTFGPPEGITGDYYEKGLDYPEPGFLQGVRDTLGNVYDATAQNLNNLYEGARQNLSNFSDRAVESFRNVRDSITGSSGDSGTGAFDQGGLPPEQLARINQPKPTNYGPEFDEAFGSVPSRTVDPFNAGEFDPFASADKSTQEQTPEKSASGPPTGAPLDSGLRTQEGTASYYCLKNGTCNGGPKGAYGERLDPNDPRTFASDTLPNNAIVYACNQSNGKCGWMGVNDNAGGGPNGVLAKQGRVADLTNGGREYFGITEEQGIAPMSVTPYGVASSKAMREAIIGNLNQGLDWNSAVAQARESTGGNLVSESQYARASVQQVAETAPLPGATSLGQGGIGSDEAASARAQSSQGFWQQYAPQWAQDAVNTSAQNLNNLYEGTRQNLSNFSASVRDTISGNSGDSGTGAFDQGGLPPEQLARINPPQQPGAFESTDDLTRQLEAIQPDMRTNWEKFWGMTITPQENAARLSAQRADQTGAFDQGGLPPEQLARINPPQQPGAFESTDDLTRQLEAINPNKQPSALQTRDTVPIPRPNPLAGTGGIDEAGFIDTRNAWQRIMPEILGGKPDPYAGVVDLSQPLAGSKPLGQGGIGSDSARAPEQAGGAAPSPSTFDYGPESPIAKKGIEGFTEVAKEQGRIPGFNERQTAQWDDTLRNTVINKPELLKELCSSCTIKNGDVVFPDSGKLTPDKFFSNPDVQKALTDTIVARERTNLAPDLGGQAGVEKFVNSLGGAFKSTAPVPEQPASPLQKLVNWWNGTVVDAFKPYLPEQDISGTARAPEQAGNTPQERTWSNTLYDATGGRFGEPYRPPVGQMSPTQIRAEIDKINTTQYNPVSGEYTGYPSQEDATAARSRELNDALRAYDEASQPKILPLKKQQSAGVPSSTVSPRESVRAALNGFENTANTLNGKYNAGDTFTQQEIQRAIAQARQVVAAGQRIPDLYTQADLQEFGTAIDKYVNNYVLPPLRNGDLRGATTALGRAGPTIIQKIQVIRAGF